LIRFEKRLIGSEEFMRSRTMRDLNLFFRKESENPNGLQMKFQEAPKRR